MTLVIPIKRIIYVVFVAIAALFVTSWIAGQCRDWMVPKEVPEKIDTGVPTAGPINAAPTDLVCLSVATPELTAEQEMAVLAKYGLKPHKTPPESSKSTSGSPVASRAVIDELKIAKADMIKIIPLSETTFTHEASGVSVDVLAFVNGFGTRIQQSAKWHPWRPPLTVSQNGDWLENEARWEKFIMLGYIGMINHDASEVAAADVAPGLGFGFAYKSWRIGHVTLEARTIGMFTIEGDGAAMGGLSASW